MNRILIVGADTVPGQAIFQTLSGSHIVNRLVLESPRGPGVSSVDRITKSKLKTGLATADEIVFCGSAARSSWDADFGTFPAERRWLDQCVESARQRNSRLVFISSDAVYAGPWIFHDDESVHLSTSDTAKNLLALEQKASTVSNSLIIRTNVIGFSAATNSYCSNVLKALQQNRTIRLDATTSSTPITCDAFGSVVDGLLESEITGCLNVGGAERTTPFHFAAMLTAVLAEDTNLLCPVVERQPQERAMRCDTVRTSIGISPPLLRETIAALQSSDYQPSRAAA